MEHVIEDIRHLAYTLEQVAREIYYAKSQMKQCRSAQANLDQALRILGVSGPMDVGLSNSILRQLNENDKDAKDR